MLKKIPLFLTLILCIGKLIANPPVSLTFEQTAGGDVLLQWQTPEGADAELIFHESFEGLTDATFPPQGWLNIDNDGDGNAWILFDVPESPNLNPYPAYDGEYAAASYSWFNGSTLTPDNWFITPALTVPDNALLHWAIAAQRPNYSQEHYKVFISTSGTDVADFTQLLHQETLPAQDITWKTRQYNISAYAGQDIYVAFVHTETTDLFAIKLDDIRLYALGGQNLEGYRIYRNDQLLAELDDPLALSFLDVAPAYGEYEYYVTAVYDDGESAPSNTVHVILEPEALDFPPQNFQLQTLEDQWIFTWDAPEMSKVFLWEDFEGLTDQTFPPSGWSNIDNEGGGMAWILFDVPYSEEVNPYPAYSGDQAIASYSWFNGVTYTPDNWFVTPAVDLDNNSLLSWAVAAQRPNYSQEHYKVYLSTSGNNVEDFTILLHEETLPEQDITWKTREVDLSEYDGQTVHVAFVHTETTDLFAIKLDAIKLDGEAALVLQGYELYENDVLIAEINDPAALEYSMNTPAAGTYEYHLVAVFDLGNSVPSETVNAQVAEQFIVNISHEGPGTVTPAGEQSVEEGGGIAVTIEADNDAWIADVLLDGVSVLDQLETDREEQAVQGTLTLADIQQDHALHVIFDIASHFDHAELSYPMTVYPNPADVMLWVELEVNNVQERTLTLYDIRGQKILSQAVAAGQTRVSVDISHLPAGVYTIGIDNSGNMQKFIIR